MAKGRGCPRTSLDFRMKPAVSNQSEQGQGRQGDRIDLPGLLTLFYA